MAPSKQQQQLPKAPGRSRFTRLPPLPLTKPSTPTWAGWSWDPEVASESRFGCLTPLASEARASGSVDPECGFGCLTPKDSRTGSGASSSASREPASTPRSSRQVSCSSPAGNRTPPSAPPKNRPSGGTPPPPMMPPQLPIPESPASVASEDFHTESIMGPFSLIDDIMYMEQAGSPLTASSLGDHEEWADSAEASPSTPSNRGLMSDVAKAMWNPQVSQWLNNLAQQAPGWCRLGQQRRGVQGTDQPDADAAAPPLQNLRTLETLSSLVDEFKYNQQFGQLVSHLRSKNYTGWRRIRGDGNCFYRAIGVGLIEEIGGSRAGGAWAAGVIERLQSLSFEDPEEVRGHARLLERTIELNASGGSIELVEDVRQEMRDSTGILDMAMVRALRSLVANFLELHSEHDIVSGQREAPDSGNITFQIACTLLGHPGLPDFVENIVRSKGTCAENPVPAAMSRVLDLNIRILVLDSRGCMPHDDTFTAPSGPDVPTVHVQLRPGHYDMLYVDGTGPDPRPIPPLPAAILDKRAAKEAEEKAATDASKERVQRKLRRKRRTEPGTPVQTNDCGLCPSSCTKASSSCEDLRCILLRAASGCIALSQAGLAALKADINETSRAGFLAVSEVLQTGGDTLEAESPAVSRNLPGRKSDFELRFDIPEEKRLPAGTPDDTELLGAQGFPLA